jgi:hypothetical protein
MEKRSDHYLDVFNWIGNIIDSCNTYEQTLTANVLIDNYQKLLISKGFKFKDVNDLVFKLNLRLMVLQHNISLNEK